MAETNIEWATDTWNPVTGCSKVSPGCAKCYAELLSLRFGWSKLPWTPENAAENVVLHPERLDQPLRWRKPRMVFVCSMADLFHEQVPDGFILDVFRIVAKCPQHTFQVLTKRPERMRDWFTKWSDRAEADSNPRLVRGPAETRAAHDSGRARLFADMIERWGEPPEGACWPTYDWMEGMRWWPVMFSNVWLGVSIENARHTWRADVLREIPAAVRFVSAEPLLGSLYERQRPLGDPDDHEHFADCNGEWPCSCLPEERKPLDLAGIDWLIAGAESGPGARPMREEWVRDLRDACQDAGTSFFYKQSAVRGRKVSLPLLDGRQWKEMPR